MAYALDVSEHLDRIFFKLSKRNKLQFDILNRKIKEILENQKVVRLLDYDHHDVVYY